MRAIPVLKGISGEHQVTKILGVGVSMRQAAIVMGAAFLCWGLHNFLSKFVSLSIVGLALIAVPVMAFAVAFAFVKHEGRNLDFWVLKFLIRLFRKDALRYSRVEPGVQTRSLRDSIQEKLLPEKLVWDMIRCKDGTYVKVLEVDPVRLSLSSESDKTRVWAAMVKLYNRVDFPFVEITRARPGSLEPYIGFLEEAVRKAVKPQLRNFAGFARQHISFLRALVKKHDIFDRKAYVLLHYKPENPVGYAEKPWWAFWSSGATPKNAAALQEEAEKANSVLNDRAEIFADGLQNAGARLRPLVDNELLALVKGETTGENLTHGEPPTVFEPVTLFHGPYQKKSPKQLTRVVRALEEYRHGATPPAIGIGNLIVNQIAPESVRIFSDCLKINDRWHATLFISEYPKTIDFGVLKGLLTLPGCVKVVKHVRPVSQEEAESRLGKQWATLVAAAETAADGNVISMNQRKIATESVAEGVEALQTGDQGLADLTVLIHCEAETKEKLFSLCGKVKSRLGQHRVKTMLAREETFEAWQTCLPTGLQLVDPRYAQQGMLTHPMAGLFTFGTYQVNHGKGILWGTEPEAGSLVIHDRQRMPNPHITALGTSGSGKSMTIKAITTRARLRGDRVVIIDPVGDSKYDRPARAIDGQYVVFGINSGHKFNPFDIGEDYLNLNLIQGSLAEKNPAQARRAAREAAFDGKILSLIQIVRLMVGGRGLDADEEGLVDRLLREVYAAKEITQDPDTHHREPPIFPDFFARLAGEESQYARELRRRLYAWEHGALRTVFDGHTNVDLSNKYLVCQIAGVQDRAKAATMFALIDFLNGMLSNPSEPSLCVVEEFWSIIEDPHVAPFVVAMYRSGRARANAMMAVTQDIEEFITSSHGKVILGLSPTKFIMLQNDETAQVVAKYFGLSEKQAEEIKGFSQGSGFLRVGDHQIKVDVKVSELEEEIFNTDPDKEPYYEQRRALRAKKAKRRRELAEQKRRPRAIAAPRTGARAVNVQGTPPRPAVGGSHPAGESPKDGRTSVVPPPRGARPANPAEEAPTAPLGPVARPDAPARHAAAPARNRETRPPAAEHAVTGQMASILPLGRRGASARVVAVVGPTSGPVAYNLAGLTASSGKDAGSRVLFVDAEGEVSESVFRRLVPPHLALPPDDLTVGGDDKPLQSYKAREPGTRLEIMRMPSNANVPADGLIARLRSAFDVIVVPCGSTAYGRDWLRSADRVVATADEAPMLAETVKYAEDLRGTNGTLLAPVRPAEVPKDGHRAFGLPPAELAGHAGMGNGFAVLNDPLIGRAFTPLLRELLDAENDQEVQRTP